MTDASHGLEAAAAPEGPLRYRRGLGALAAALLLLGGALALSAASGSHHARALHGATASTARPGGGHAGAAARGKQGTATPGPGIAVAGSGSPGAGSEIEVADPEESSSYPVAASSLHNKSAAAPAAAGSQVVAPGAPSNAEVREELAQMAAAEHAAARAQKLKLAPVPGGESIGGNGTIPIPDDVPEVVQRVIAGANEIADFPYVFGGGHGSFVDNAYDCSGSVSYALAAGGLLSAPETSGQLESWGAAGPGHYITVLANAGHTYMYVDGILYDTAGRSGPFASRWQVAPTDNAGYVVRHWPGL